MIILANVDAYTYVLNIRMFMIVLYSIYYYMYVHTCVCKYYIRNMHTVCRLANYRPVFPLKVLKASQFG